MTDNKKITISKKTEPDLYKRSIKGGYWVFASNILELAKTILIANLFRLEDLGLLSICYMLISLLSQFSESGLQNALIQKKDEITREYLDTTWVVGILRGIALSLILFFVAPFFVTLIDKTPLAEISTEKIPLAVSIIRVIGLCFVIQGFRNIGTIFFQKDLRFHKVFYLSVIGTLFDFVLTVILVLVFRSIWGVIISRVAVSLITCVFSFILSPYRPRFRFHPAKAMELWKFGKWIYGQQIINYILTEGDDFFVLFYLGLPSLALYRHAFRFACIPATHITNIISRISFPAYAKIQNDIPRLKEAYLKVLRITSLSSIPIAFLIFILCPDFVHLTLPERMYPIIPVMQILAFKGLIKSIGSTRGPLFRALGKPQIAWHLHLLRLVILGCSIYPLTKMWGIAGTAIATVTLNVVIGPLGVLITKRLLKCTFMDTLRMGFLPFLASAAMLAWIAIFKKFLFQEVSYPSFIILFLSAIIVYGGTAWIIALYLDKSYIIIIKELLGLKKLKIENIAS